ncbi:hypothetical protein CHARACLAT_027017 [Characodon lateralis]|uniref:Secreted protein n=1 Tax=Characodon lateralis TaxID=208331 RepID=A0ABU7DK78_9TELE|nr:hypothetical protein [Characodon lateralis]
MCYITVLKTLILAGNLIFQKSCMCGAERLFPVHGNEMCLICVLPVLSELRYCCGIQRPLRYFLYLI